MESSTLVIKVKFGDTLRRFTAGVDENKELELDIIGLRAKINGLFNFPSESDPSLTYIDEDGDIVTLVDDDDLHDVMRQHLKVLRIDVKLKQSDKLGKYFVKSSANSTQPEQPKSNRDDAEVSKPVRETIAKLCLDHSSKAASANYVAADLLNQHSKVRPSLLNPVSQAPDLESNGSNRVSTGSLASPMLVDSNPSYDRNVQDVLLKFNAAIKKTKPEDIGNSSKTVPALVRPTDSNLDRFARPYFKLVQPTDFSFFNNAPKPSPHAVDAYKNSCGRLDPWGGIFHRGVTCDGCEVNPIAGPRYKSKVKEDYDLCVTCFTKMGNQQDYIRIDRPIPYLKQSQFFGAQYHYPPAPALPRHVNTLLKAIHRSHDSCFIMDVSIMDGTVMAPSTPFTKIWRMRNNGTAPWQQGVRLVWIQGDKFADSTVAEFQVPKDGVPVDGVLDIAVNFIAPAVPGRYISFWKMESPSGIKFGQQVWVLIEVDDLLNESLCGGFQRLNLNLPPASSSRDFVGPGTVDAIVKPESVTQVFVEEPLRDQQLNDAMLVSEPISASSWASSSVSYPIIDSSPAVVPIETQSNFNGVPSSDKMEQSLLIELDEMGFKQVELNKEILRENDYDMQLTLDELCSVEKWDPILEELMDMGFRDVETNKRLLKKHNGSIMGVVMDLFAEANP
ncbi:hypothetical protein ACFE04_027790 [Oxalis oulophora]